MQSIFIFNGNGSSKFSGGVFTTKKVADDWIARHSLTGILTNYPINVGVYDWAIENKLFTPRKEHEFRPEFIGGFSTASQEHYHYENGECLNGDDEANAII